MHTNFSFSLVLDGSSFRVTWYICLSIYFLHILGLECLILKRLVAAIGRLCEKDDGKCVICDSYVRPCTLVRICDECNYGSYQGRCVICGGPGVSDAYYCKECTVQEKDVSINVYFLYKINIFVSSQ